MTVRSFIVEDEPLARKTLRQLISETSWLEFAGEAGDGLSAVKQIDDIKPDIVFLDIELAEMNGLQVLETIKHQPEVVFTTAYDSYALSAFEVDALDYLLKPFGRERFAQTLDRVRRRLGTTDREAPTIERARHAFNTVEQTPLTRVFVRERDSLRPVMVEDIVRLEACDDYTQIHANQKKFLIHLGLSEFTARLDPTNFLRVHRSHTVNLNHVTSAEEFDRRLVLYLSDGSEVTASRSGTQQFRKLLTLV